MKTMIFLAVAALASLSGCKDKAPADVRTVTPALASTTAAPDPARQIWLTEQRARLAALRAQQDAFEKRADAISAEMRKDYDTEVASLRTQRQALDDRIARAEDARDDAKWAEFKRDVNGGLTSLEASVKRGGERFGTAVDRAVNDTNNNVDTAAERIEHGEDKVEKAGDKVENGINEAGKKIGDGLEKAGEKVKDAVNDPATNVP